jgi:hypothetical protein
MLFLTCFIIGFIADSTHWLYVAEMVYQGSTGANNKSNFWDMCALRILAPIIPNDKREPSTVDIYLKPDLFVSQNKDQGTLSIDTNFSVATEGFVSKGSNSVPAPRQRQLAGTGPPPTSAFASASVSASPSVSASASIVAPHSIAAASSVWSASAYPSSMLSSMVLPPHPHDLHQHATHKTKTLPHPSYAIDPLHCIEPSTRPVAVDQVVRLLGYPGIQTISIDWGRVVQNNPKGDLFTTLLSDDGSSGGPVVDSHGYLIGLLSRSHENCRYSCVQHLRDLFDILHRLNC